MSARQLSRLAKAKGLEPLLGGGLNVDSDESEESESSGEGERRFGTGAGISSLAFGDDSSDETSSSEDEDDDDTDSGDGGGKNDHLKQQQPSTTTPPTVVGLGKSLDSEIPSPGCSINSSNVANNKTASNKTASTTDAGVTASTIVVPSSSILRKHEAPKSTTSPSSPAVTSKGQRKIIDDDDDEYLDSVISELAKAAASGGSAEDLQTGVSSALARFLRCDPRSLKLDQELRRKFGGGMAGDGENGAAAGGGGGRARRQRRGMMIRGGNTTAPSLALKRLVVSAPKEDWPKPPSFVGGGLGMRRCDTPPKYLPKWQLEAHRGAGWFVFERSSSLEHLQRKFEAIQGMHDPNVLAVFASRAPYHADSLLQLGMVFAHTGQMDHASDFVGRSLYVLESAAMEAFRPVEGTCRLDASLEVNKTYMAAMFRHMQMSGMVGGARTALEVGRLLLSVDPLGDPMGCLLALDSHALASREGNFLLELYRLKLLIGYSPAELTKASSAATRDDVRFEPPDVTVQDLPGINMSMCLAMLDTTKDTVAAREAMACTLLRFPVMLEPLLEKCGLSPRSTTYPHNWKMVMQHSHFGGAKNRLPRGHVLLHLSSIFSQRGGEIWKHERAQELLYDGAGIALQSLSAPPTAATPEVEKATGGARIETVPPAKATVAAAAAVAAAGPSPSSGASPSRLEEETLQRAYGKDSPINKYLDLPLSDFAESFALLPQDANILDPRLMGPNFMNERVRWRMPAGGGEGAGLRGGGQDMLDEVLARAVQAIGRNEAGGGWDRGGGAGGRRGRAGRAEGNLNPEAPLMQLFWQTLMPWNVFSTPSRPIPPPPRWL